MVHFKPVGDKHSLLMTGFAITLSRALDEREVDSLGALVQQLKAELPSLSDVQQPVFELNTQTGFSHSNQLRKAGYLLQRIAPSGQAEWRLDLSGNKILVQCFVYTRWDPIWATARGLLSRVCAAIATAAPDINATSFILGVVDKFVNAMSDSSADGASTIFDPSSPYLTKQNLRSESQWHVHQGWFEPPDLGLRILQVLNISSLLEASTNLGAGGMNVNAVVIDHNCHFNFEVGLPVSEAFQADGPADRLFARGHQYNKSILNETLSMETRKAIGLLQ